MTPHALKPHTDAAAEWHPQHDALTGAALVVLQLLARGYSPAQVAGRGSGGRAVGP